MSEKTIQEKICDIVGPIHCTTSLDDSLQIIYDYIIKQQDEIKLMKLRELENDTDIGFENMSIQG